jgi:hypothetical protein
MATNDANDSNGLSNTPPQNHAPAGGVLDAQGIGALPEGPSFGQLGQGPGIQDLTPAQSEGVGMESSVEQDTRAVALDLGLLSVNETSEQVRYLGSSSGSLFASIFQARASMHGHLVRRTDSDFSKKDNDNTGTNSFISKSFDLEDIRDATNTLYELLRRVSYLVSTKVSLNKNYHLAK